MPTGYTAMLDDNPQMDTRKWVMEVLARAFGICVTLRDEGLNLTEEQIKKKITEDSSISYHKKELANAKKLVKEYTVRTEEKWKTLWEESEAKRIKHNEESTAKCKAMSERHLKVRKDLELILQFPHSDEVTRNIAKYGIDQLNLVKDETEPFIIGPSSLEQFKEDAIANAKRDIIYHTKELEETQERVTGRLAAYERLKQDVDNALFAEKLWNARQSSVQGEKK